MEEIRERNNHIDSLTKEFLIDTVVIVSCFLIRCFENENPRKVVATEENIFIYDDAQDFNEFWDEIFGDFEMGEYSYTASEILYDVDNEAYMNEYKGFKENQELEND